MNRVRFVDLWLGAIAFEIALVGGIALAGGRMSWDTALILVAAVGTIEGIFLIGISRL